MSVVVNGITYLPSADGKIYGQYLNGDAPISGGTLTDGASFVISGAGFGTKSTPGPLVYDDFESGTLGGGIDGQSPTIENIGGAWTWDTYTSLTHLPEYSNIVLRTNSSRSAYMEYETDTYANALKLGHNMPNTGDAVYFSFWQYYDKTSVGWTRNWKPWIVYGSAGIFPSAYIGFGEVGVDPVLRNAIQDTGVNEVTLWDSIEIDEIEGEWLRHEFYLVQSSPGEPDGEWHHILHRTATPSISTRFSETAYETRGGSDYWNSFEFGAYNATDANGSIAGVYMDQIYFDTTRQRVELGDASTWAACTHREIQPATAWSNTEITITGNAGTFANNDTAYLYVVTADGNPISTNGISVQVSV